MKKSFLLLFVFSILNSGLIAQVSNKNDSTKDILPAVPVKIIGKTLVCNSTTQTYTIEPVKNAKSYFWKLPNGWTGNSTTTSITTVVGNNSGSLCVLSVNDSGMSKAVRMLPVSVSKIPAQPGKIKGDSIICAGSSKTYKIDYVEGASFYTWTLPSGWKGTSTTNIITLTSGTKTGNIMVTAGNICGSSIARQMARGTKK